MYHGNKCLVAAVFGLITTCCYALYWWAVISPLVKHLRPWRIWHYGCIILGLIVFIAIINFLTFSAIFHFPITAGLFLMFLQWTLIIGAIITVLSIGIEYNRSLRQRMQDLLNNTTDEQRDITVTNPHAAQTEPVLTQAEQTINQLAQTLQAKFLEGMKQATKQ